MTILVVDDEKEIADLLEVVLTNEGYEILKCYDPHSALKILEARINPLELVARVKAQLRRYTRYNSHKNDESYEFNGLMIDPKTHTCTLFEENVSLTPTEFKILWLLCENAGNVVSSETIFEKVWGEDFFESNNTVMVHIRRIREKLKEPSKNPRYIKTVWGVGYKIEKPCD